MLVKELSSWTISLLKESNAWFWNGLGGLWSWTLGLWPWFWSLGLSGQLAVTAILLAISLYLFWKTRRQGLPDRIFLAVTWPVLTEAFAGLTTLMCFYGVWFMGGFVAFACVMFIGIFEIPIRAIASLF